MTEFETKSNIETSLENFQKGDLYQNAINLFEVLGYNTKRQAPLEKKDYNTFKSSFIEDINKFNEEKALVKEWKYVDFLFQLSKEEISNTTSLFDTGRVDNTIIESYLFFVIELKNKNYNRTALSRITREVNRIFSMPVMLLFKYGNSLTLSVINRRLHKRDESKDVLKKVTLIKDIDIKKPHRAHKEILLDLSFDKLFRVHNFTNFVELHNAWQKTLDTKELNKKFYKELSNWYFWAMDEVYFPGADLYADKNSPLFTKEYKEREHNATNLIRLLTRLLFVWFVKEKGLVPEELFDDKKYLPEELLVNFKPKKEKGNSLETESCYYRAILQNLFFATLNQNMGKRQFRIEKQNFNVTNLMRYKKYFKDPHKFINLVEKSTPFMNGGLFECLDVPDPERKGKQGGDVVNYLDGFSDRPDNPLKVPDYIFFGKDEHADLSEELGNKKQKDVTVKGIINILKSYKFTVAENTPIEEEVALDPELLGRVFENLLASYNPETKTTARKQTGSFYTPREIVNYMVDESLKAYLRRKLESEAGMKPEDLETGLEYLIGYNEKGYDYFNSVQTAILIKAIDSCKILDPACGSGAFPMGILHKLTHILHKLDPQNKLWKERQIEKAESLDDADIRENLINDIEIAFSNNELDYGRKLYLIENCIYGVDIQPIATQISKLRCFISLIVDQKANKDKDNFDIRPLPNLEIKFVAANTLIGIEKFEAQGSLFDKKEVNEIEAQIKDVRHRLFSAKTPKTKRDLRKKDKTLREKLGDLLIKNGWGNETARQLAGWDPYDQNTSSTFFNPEWMFGIMDGFDIIIGNPPYLESRHPSFSDELKSAYQINCKNRWGDDATLITRGADLLIYFFETSISLISKNGNIILITQNAWLDTDYGIKAQKFLTKHTNVISIIDSKYRYFPAGEGPNINTVISIFHGQESVPNNIVRFYVLKKNIQEIVLESKDNKSIDNENYKLNLFSYSDDVFNNYKWGILHNADSFILELINILENQAVTIDNIPSKSKYSFGQGLNLKKSAIIPLEILQKHAIKTTDCFPVLNSGTPYCIKKTEWYLVRKKRVDKSVISKLHADGYIAFDENSTRKEPPILIMPRGISKHFCCYNSISAYSLSGVDVYASGKMYIENEVLNLWCYFNSSLFWLLREVSGRKNLGGGLLKSEATDLKAFPVYMELNLKKEMFISLFERDANETIGEILSKDHQIIDAKIYDYLGFNEDYRTKCKEYLRKAIVFRSTRAGT